MALSVTGPGVATRRGLTVGDPAARALALYGPPARQDDGYWEYLDPKEPQGLHIIRITVRNDLVTGIFLGTVLD